MVHRSRRADPAAFIPLAVSLFRRSPALGVLAFAAIAGVWWWQAGADDTATTGSDPSLVSAGSASGTVAAEPAAVETASDVPTPAPSSPNTRSAEAPAPAASKTSAAPRVVLGRDETLVTLRHDRLGTLRVVAPKTRIVLRSDGGGITLAGQLNADEAVRLTDGSATVRARSKPRDKDVTPVVRVPAGAVRVTAVAAEDDRVLLALGNGRSFAAAFARGLPTPDGGTVAADRVRVGTLLAATAGGDLLADPLPTFWEPDPVVQNARIVNFDRVIYTGPVDLSDTLARIALKRRFPHNNDGSVFQNRERRLPQRRAGHYREYVHPTDGVGGPGPQRLVVGAAGRVWYTGDHYDSFREIGGR